MYRRSIFWFYLAILSAAASVYLLGNQSVQLWDRDEPRFAQTSRQMLQSGDWVVPRFLNTIRDKKPVFIYWCQATSMKYLGDNAFAARFPSVLAMLLTLSLLAITITREKGNSPALWTIFIFSSCALAIGAAKMCLTDSVLLFFIVISQLCIYRIWKYGISVTPFVLLGLSIGFAGLTKGPVALGINLTTIAALWLLSRKQSDTDLPRLKPKPMIIGIAIVITIVSLVVLPWVMEVSKRAPGFISGSIERELLDRAHTGQEGHSYWPGFYALVMWGTYFPWSLLVPAAIVSGWRNRRDPAIRFALAALVGPWVMFEIIVTKLPHYVLPTYPALAYLTADMLIRAAAGTFAEIRWASFKVTAWIWAVFISTLGAGGIVASRVAGENREYLFSIAIVIFITTVLMAFGTAWRFSHGNVLAAARAMGLGMYAIVAVAYSMYLPRFEPARLSLRIANVITANGGYGKPGMMIDYKEPSLAFHSGGGLIEQRENNYINLTSEENWPEWIIITHRYWEKIIPEKQARFDVIGNLHGLTYNENQSSDVMVLRRKM